MCIRLGTEEVGLLWKKNKCIKLEGKEWQVSMVLQGDKGELFALLL